MHWTTAVNDAAQNKLGHGDTQGLHCISWLKLLLASCGVAPEPEPAVLT